MSTPLLELRGAGRSFRHGHEITAVAGVSLAAYPGELLAITGASGSGKSTLLSMLGCLDSPTTGQVLVCGEDATAATDLARTRLRQRAIGFVFQQFHLVPFLTAVGNVEAALLYRGLRPAVRRRRARAALAAVGLADRLEHHPAQLSGGEQQRVAIARAVVTDPAIVLADEPTGNLDSASAERVLEILAGCVAPHRVVIVVTHAAEVAARAHRRLRMRDGRLEVDSGGTAYLPADRRFGT